MKKKYIFILILVFLIIYLIVNLSIGSESFKSLKNIIPEQTRQTIKKIFFPHKIINEKNNIIKLIDEELQLIRDRYVKLIINDDYSLKTIQNEIDKCEVRCANCHTKKTAEEFKWEIFKEDKIKNVSREDLKD